MALLSQARKSECDMAQTSSCIAGFNVLNMRYVRTTAGNQDLSQLEVIFILSTTTTITTMTTTNTSTPSITTTNNTTQLHRSTLLHHNRIAFLLHSRSLIFAPHHYQPAPPTYTSPHHHPPLHPPTTATHHHCSHHQHPPVAQQECAPVIQQ